MIILIFPVSHPRMGGAGMMKDDLKNWQKWSSWLQ